MLAKAFFKAAGRILDPATSDEVAREIFESVLVHNEIVEGDPVHYRSPFRVELARAGQFANPRALATLQNLVARNFDLDTICVYKHFEYETRNSATMLHFAIADSQSEFVRLLLGCGADPLKRMRKEIVRSLDGHFDNPAAVDLSNPEHQATIAKIQASALKQTPSAISIVEWDGSVGVAFEIESLDAFELLEAQNVGSQPDAEVKEMLVQWRARSVVESTLRRVRP